MDVSLQLECGSYDRIEPLKDRTVRPAGIELLVTTFDDPRVLFDQAASSSAFDLVEFSLAEHVGLTARGASPFLGLPVFTSRVFRHSFICCNANAGVNHPKDLEGRTIGVPRYGMSAAIWCRGLLRDDYGVDLSGVTWIEGRMEAPGTHGVANQPSRGNAQVKPNIKNASLTELLECGEIDATLGALMPSSFGRSDKIKRLFPNFRAVERDYYKRTSIHPIMHFIAVRKEQLDAAAWIVPALLGAFAEAKARALRRLAYTGAPKSMLPFLHAEWEETTTIFGDDPWPDGVAANETVLNRFIDYMRDDGLIDRAPALSELFVPSA